MKQVVVIGGGHAGIEAAYIAARMGMATTLLTMNLDQIGQMSCNPSIGGVGKGHMVRELDALGGAMGRLIDATGIHFRILNESRGVAVRGPRAQADKVKYRSAARQLLEHQPELKLRQGMATASSTVPIFRSTLPRRQCAIAAETDAATIWLAPVATAMAGEMPMNIRSGVIINPPPTPNRPERKPTPPPMPRITRKLTDISAMGR